MAALAGAQHNLVELLDGLQCALVLHRVLVSVLGLLAQRTRCSDETLAADGSEDIVGIKSVLCHYIGLEPDAQGIGVTQCHHIAHTGDTHQSGPYIDVDVVSDEISVILTVHALQGADVQDVTLLLHHLHTYVGHL